MINANPKRLKCFSLHHVYFLSQVDAIVWPCPTLLAFRVGKMFDRGYRTVRLTSALFLGGGTCLTPIAVTALGSQ
jgi:hypothetical protein